MPIVSANHLDEVAAALLAGGVAAIPTDTVYGLAARADRPEAIRAIIALKGREPRQPIAMLFDAPADIERYVDAADALVRFVRHWPGPLTLVVRARSGVEIDGDRILVAEDGTLGIRQPDDSLARQLLRAVGGVLAVTSANRSGQPPATTAEECAAIFGPDLLVLDGGPRRTLAASTVLDATSKPPRILRAGPLTAAALGIDP